MAVPVPHLLVPRAARAAELAQSLQTLDLTILLTPPGYGKTTLLGLGCERLPFAVVRYRAELWHAADFVEPLVAAIRTLRPDFGRNTLALARRRPREASAIATWSRRLGATFASELDYVREPLLVAIDDVQLFADDRTFAAFLDGALRALPGHVHLALAGRALPDLSIAEWLAAGRARVFSVDEIRFDADDVRALAEKSGRRISSHELATFATLYEGWAAGLALAFAAGKAAVPSASGSLSTRSAYLIETNLRSLADEIVAFLEDTAVFETLDATLLEREPRFALARARLAVLERRGVMLEVIAPGAVVRLHPLLREALVARVRARGAVSVADAHRAAAQLFESAGRIREALYHYEAAADDRALADFIGRHAHDSFVAGLGERLARIAARLERSHVDASAIVALVEGMIARQRGEPGAEEAFLRGIDRAGTHDPVGVACLTLLVEDKLARRVPIAPGEIAALADAARDGGPSVEIAFLVLTGWLAAIAGDFEDARIRAQRAVSLASDDPIGRARAAALAAYAATCIGAFDRADAIMADSLRLLESSEQVVLLANTLVWYARFALLWNDAGAARDYAERGLALARELDLPAELAGAELALAEVFARTPDREHCTAAAERAVRGSANAWYARDRSRTKAMAALFSARAACGAGDGRTALAAVRAALEAPDVPSAQRLALLADCAAYAMMTRDEQRSNAFEHAHDACALATAGDALDAAQISDAACLLATIAAGAPAPARSEPAPNGAVTRVYGAYLAARVATQRAGDAMDALVVALRPSTEARQSRATRHSELTPREREILALIAQGLTNREIAQRFALSPRTVDTHVERVLSKLDAKSRTRAVATAIRLGLV